MTDGVTVRPARSDDRAAVIEMTREVWGGADYVPYVWDTWLNSSRGLIIVAEEGGRVAGLQHQYLQDDGNAWLEGIRVAPDRRGNGIAEKLMHEGLRWARWHGCNFARLTASSENPASNRLAQAAGFQFLHAFEPLVADRALLPSHSTRVAHPSDFHHVQKLVRDQTTGAVPFLLEGWTAKPWSPSTARRLLGTQAVLVGETMRSLAVVTCGYPFAVARISFSLGTADEIEPIGRSARASAAVAGIPEVRAMVPAGSPMSDGFKASGFRSQHQFQTNLYQLSLAP